MIHKDMSGSSAHPRDAKRRFQELCEKFVLSLLTWFLWFCRYCKFELWRSSTVAVALHLEVMSAPYFTSHALNGWIKICNILSRILTLRALWSQLSFNRLFCNGISFNFKSIEVDSHHVIEMLKFDSGLDMTTLGGPPIATRWTVEFQLLFSLEWNQKAIFRGIRFNLPCLWGAIAWTNAFVCLAACRGPAVAFFELS